MKLLLIDDEVLFHQRFQKSIKNYMPEAEVDYYTYLSEDILIKKYDIVFLDIVLVNQESFDFANVIKNVYSDTTLVYVSNYENFVFQTYCQDCFFFVRKSQLELDLSHFAQKYCDLKLLMKDTFEIRIKGQKLVLPQHKIIYFEKQKDTLVIYLEDKTYELRLSLYVAYQMLNKKVFFKLNSSTIINLKKVINVRSQYIIMSNGDNIYFTRRSKSEFMKVYNDFLEAQYGIR